MALVSNTPTDFTITLNSLGSGNASASAAVDNKTNGYLAALLSIAMTSGTAPTAGTTYDVFLLRADNDGASTNRDDDWTGGSMNGTFDRENAPFIGSIVVTATLNKTFSRFLPTWKAGPLGPEWGIAIKNSTNQSTNSNSALFKAAFFYVIPDRAA